MRTSTARLTAIAALVVTTCAGCALSWTPSFVAGSRKADVEQSKRGPGDATATDEPSDDPADNSLAQANAMPLTPDVAFADVVGELKAIGAIDREAERDLLRELQDAKPEHYKLIVDQYRAALAYRKQLAQRDAERLERQRREAYDDAQLHLVSTAKRPADAVSQAWPDSRALTGAMPPATTMASNQPPLTDRLPTPSAATSPQRVQLADHRSTPLPPPPATLASAEVNPNDVDARVTTAGFIASAPPATQRQRDWRSELDDAIGTLENSTTGAPRTVDELHDHLRLRMLLMLAGRDEDALAPIPGATPAQQDFWSKQLFALSAFLDAADSGDERARAAATLRHLDDARDRLSELATLQVRNAAFVKRVDGFGLYEPIETAEFQPGEQIIVYAEINNFRSRSTAEGYETSLGTSYQVVDESGRRVDGAQFPDVQDICQSRRHDFHMQYEMQLPTRIYPGPYQLQLIITDHASNKIGQTTLAFEIVDEPSR